MTELDLSTRMGMYSRLFAMQASWNYELLMGVGIGFCVEPALRALPEGRGGTPYREALARECRYFNAHPYLASVAVGALARAELDRAPGDKIERFRTALCGPLGSVGDRLVWAGWLPVCSVLALVAFGLGARPLVVVGLFLLVYNVGHFALRGWGLTAGWKYGMGVAKALATPVFRDGPRVLARLGALLAGIALPVTVARITQWGVGGIPGRWSAASVLAITVVGSALLVRMHGRAEGWRVALGVLTALTLFAVAVPRG